MLSVQSSLLVCGIFFQCFICATGTSVSHKRVAHLILGCTAAVLYHVYHLGCTSLPILSFVQPAHVFEYIQHKRVTHLIPVPIGCTTAVSCVPYHLVCILFFVSADSLPADFMYPPPPHHHDAIINMFFLLLLSSGMYTPRGQSFLPTWCPPDPPPSPPNPQPPTRDAITVLPLFFFFSCFWFQVLRGQSSYRFGAPRRLRCPRIDFRERKRQLRHSHRGVCPDRTLPDNRCVA